jgi:hypothetical protein
MSSRDTEAAKRLRRSTRALKRVSKVTRLSTKREAARRLRVSASRLRLLIALDLVETVKVRGEELIYL